MLAVKSSSSVDLFSNKQTSISSPLCCSQEQSFLNNLPNHILFDIISYLKRDSPADLVSLSMTCRILNEFVNFQLYDKIVLFDNKASLTNKKRNSDFTLLRQKNLDKFVNALRSKDGKYLHKIHRFAINVSDTAIITSLLHHLTKSRSLSFLDINDLQLLKQLANDVSYGERINLDFNDDVEAENFYRSGSHPYALNELSRFRRLREYQVMNAEGLESLDGRYTRVDTLKLFFQPDVHVFDSMTPLKNSQIFARLTSLYLNSPTSTLCFMYQLKDLPRLKLNRLSITNTHSFKNFGFTSINTKLSFKRLNQLIDMNTVKELELKLNCDHQQCNSCLIEFFDDWYHYTVHNSGEHEEMVSWGESIENLSLINYKNNSFNQWCYIIEEYLPRMRNLKKLYVNLDDFTYLPFLSLNHETTLNINELYELRSKLYRAVNKLGPNLKELTIADFYHNWLIYSNAKERLNFLNFLNRCDCVECQEARYAFGTLATIDSMSDFNHSFSCHNDDSSLINIELDNHNHLKDHYNNYRLSNFLIIELKKRFGLTNTFTIDSMLDVTRYPKNSHNHIDDESNPVHGLFNKLVKLLIHNLEPELIGFVSSLPDLNYICLGGIYFQVFKSRVEERIEFKVVSLYDDYEFVFVR